MQADSGPLIQANWVSTKNLSPFGLGPKYFGFTANKTVVLSSIKMRLNWPRSLKRLFLHLKDGELYL